LPHLNKTKQYSVDEIQNEPWIMENDLLTPTMKIRRRKIENQYVDKFEPWAKQKCSVVWA